MKTTNLQERLQAFEKAVRYVLPSDVQFSVGTSFHEETPEPELYALVRSDDDVVVGAPLVSDGLYVIGDIAGEPDEDGILPFLGTLIVHRKGLGPYRG